MKRIPIFNAANAATALLGVLAGCASPSQAPSGTHLATPFSASDIAWSKGEGTATVAGRAAVPGGNATPHTCAGSEAQLVPASAYASEMMRMVFGNDTRAYATFASSPHYPDNLAPAFKDAVRRVGCDAQGGFRFDHVPAGSWYVFSSVIWREGAGDTQSRVGGMLMQRVNVAPGAHIDVALMP